MTISNVIYKYLQHNRRLVIPNLGAFMVKASGEIIFSELLKGDDGVFRTLLMAEGLSEFEIAAVTDRFVFEARHAISGQGCYILGDWGALVKGTDGGLYFERRNPEDIKIEQKSVSKIEEPLAKPKVENKTPEKVSSQPTPQPAPHPAATPQPKLVRKEETKPEAEASAKEHKNPSIELQKPRVAPASRRPIPQQKRGTDRFIALAVIVLVLALAAIGYGYYVSQLAPDADDAQMEALRIEVGRPNNN